MTYWQITQNYPTGFDVKQHHVGPQTFTIYDSVRRTRNQYHHITLISPVTSLVFTWGKWKEWGYLVDGWHVDFETYRLRKNKVKNV